MKIHWMTSISTLDRLTNKIFLILGHKSIIRSRVISLLIIKIKFTKHSIAKCSRKTITITLRFNQRLRRKRYQKTLWFLSQWHHQSLCLIKLSTKLKAKFNSFLFKIKTILRSRKENTPREGQLKRTKSRIKFTDAWKKPWVLRIYLNPQKTSRRKRKKRRNRNLRLRKNPSQFLPQILLNPLSFLAGYVTLISSKLKLWVVISVRHIQIRVKASK